MKELTRYINDMAPHYLDIGLELDITYSRLKVIKNDLALPDIKKKCTEMLAMWLESDTSTTWKRLCEALEEVGQDVLASNIRKMIISA